MPANLPDQSRAVYSAMRDDCRKTSSLHPRRTLDQFFYSTLPETSVRDRDQVVSKNTGTSRGGKKMVMVDQMWLWVVESADHETAVLTCFPQKHEEGGDAEECFHGIADLRQAVLDGVNGREEGAGAPGWNDLVGILLDQAVNAMLSVRNEQSLDFLSVFRMAIGKAVSRPPLSFSSKNNHVATVLRTRFPKTIIPLFHPHD
ncbi:hypothetical protein IMZ48_47385 [Candidatus Bathyarchaeota archaeon]|nr:hypothetical protein [Candidatus Bathyarchaeota archaeon]